MTRELYRPITSIILHKYTQTEMNSPSCHRPLGRFRHAASQSKLPLLLFFDDTDRAPPSLDDCVAPHGPSPAHHTTRSGTSVVWRPEGLAARLLGRQGRRWSGGCGSNLSKYRKACISFLDFRTTPSGVTR